MQTGRGIFVVAVIALSILLLLIFAYVLIGYLLSNAVIKPNVINYDLTYLRTLENGEYTEEEIKSWSKNEVLINSSYGYSLHGFFFPKKNSNKLVVICHGITWSLWGSIKYMKLYKKLGFNVLVYDHRNHGKSGGSDTTFGFYEKKDLKACITWAIEETKKNNLVDAVIVGTHGESLGAATVLEHLAIDNRISFCVADCPFSDLEELLRLRLRKDKKLSPFLVMNIVDNFVKRRSGFNIHDVSPINDVKGLDTPVLFVHGAEDTYIPNSMSKEMLSIRNNKKDSIFIAPNAGHAQSLIKNPIAYEDNLKDFLISNSIL